MSVLGRIRAFGRNRLRSSHAANAQVPITAALDVEFEDDLLKVSRLGDVSAPNVIVAFTRIQHGLGQIAAEEFVGSSRMQGYSALFVSDMRCSWYNNFEGARLLEILSPFLTNKRVVTLGNSMGGFGAIWASRLVGAASTLAFAPQFSVKPEIVPNEQRWMNFRSRIACWRVDSLSGCFDSRTRYITINGDADCEHFQHFRSSENQTHLLIHDSGHNPASVLKKAGLVKEVVALAAAGLDPFERIRQSGINVSRIGV